MTRGEFLKTIGGLVLGYFGIKYKPKVISSIIPDAQKIQFLGFKGKRFMDSGAVYAPYIPIYSTPVIFDPESFKPSDKIIEMYSEKTINPSFYGKFTI